MHLQSRREVLTTDEDIVQVAFDLSGSEAGYLIISYPAPGASQDEFFGADHYVEIKDQKFGAYGGLERLMLVNERSVTVRLTKDVALLGREFEIQTAEPPTAELLRHLLHLQRP